MPDIRYVCLSDMHLGEEDSLLTRLKTDASQVDPYAPSEVMIHLVACLEKLIRANTSEPKPTLILCGDILELALATTGKAAMIFERFMELVMPRDKELFERVLYIPGNHDHHIWEMARETQYVRCKIVEGRGPELSDPYHSTRMFYPEPLSSFFLSRLVKTSAKTGSFDVEVAYPNFGVVTDDGSRCVIFHHGHFVESLYQLMSIVMKMVFPQYKMPATAWKIEEENFAWIDFFWSTLGRSGDVGEGIETIYENMSDPERLKKLLSNLADGLAKKIDIRYVPEFLEPKALRIVLNLVLGKYLKSERSDSTTDLSTGAHRDLWSYMTGPIRWRILEDRDNKMPTDVTFVFGHTHKPFEKDLDFRGHFPQWVNTYNTGGWVVDSMEPQEVRGGAVVLVDEDLNTASLRMYNEYSEVQKYEVKVCESLHDDDNETDFCRHIRTLVDSSADPWRAFSNEVARDVRVRMQNFRVRMSTPR